MAEQSRLFLGLVRPPKLMGLPIMYAMAWLFGSVLLFVWVQSWVGRCHFGGHLSPPVESRRLGLSFFRCGGDDAARDPANIKPQSPWRRQLCPVMKFSTRSHYCLNGGPSCIKVREAT